MADGQLNHKISRMYELCLQLWPDEFQREYAGRRQDFNAWLNGKTGLNEDHSTDKAKAVCNWLDELEHIARKKG